MQVLMSFLANILREEGGFEFKRAIMETVLSLINEIPDAVEQGPPSSLPLYPPFPHPPLDPKAAP